MFDAERFYQDYGIPCKTKSSKVTEGWIGIDCPFCNEGDYRLGFNLSTGAVSCWSCGTHSHMELVQTLLNCSWATASDILKSYEVSNRRSKTVSDSIKEKIKVDVCKWPSGTARLSERGKAYLSGRGFNPEELEKVWGLMETGPFGDYKFRIMIPITINGIMVSYQGRDITGLSDKKYKACKSVNEVMDHQDIVYGADLVPNDTALVVEGAADCWRMGPGAISCFGIAFTMAQVNFIASRYKKVYILFDTEEKAQKLAYELAILLNSKGVETYVLELESGDPGEMLQEESNKLMKELFG